MPNVAILETELCSKIIRIHFALKYSIYFFIIINLDELRRLSAETGFSSKLLEKDYHLTKMLQKISEKKYLESVSSGSTRSTINLIDVKDIEITIRNCKLSSSEEINNSQRINNEIFFKCSVDGLNSIKSNYTYLN